MNMSTHTPVSNAILTANEGDVDEFDLLAEIETALTQTNTSTTDTTLSHTQSSYIQPSSLIPVHSYKSSILDIDDDSDNEQYNTNITATSNVAILPSHIAHTVTNTHTQSPIPAAINSSAPIQPYKRKKVDAVQYVSLDEKAIDEAKAEQNNKLLRLRFNKYYNSLTHTQKHQYTIHSTYMISSNLIKSILQYICQTNKIANQLPHIMVDAIKSSIMHITETARELQSIQLQQQYDIDPNNIKSVYDEPIKPIQPIYYKLAYIKLTQQGKLPTPKPVSRKRMFS